MKILLVDEDPVSCKQLEELFLAQNGNELQAEGLSYQFNKLEHHSEFGKGFHRIYPDVILINLASIEQAFAGKVCDYVRKVETNRHTGIIYFNVNIKENDFGPVAYLEMGGDDVVRLGASNRELLARTNSVLKFKFMTDQLRNANHKLKLLSYTDELTGLSNMRAFNGLYAKAIEECKKGSLPLGVIMMDLDHFKQVNDKTNHLMGSHVISQVGAILRHADVLDKKDCAARFGGDEYIIFTQDICLADVMSKAEEIRKLIAGAVFLREGMSIKITASIGVSWTLPGYIGKDEDPIKLADMMLYVSKHLGRDRVSGEILRDPIDLDHISSRHAVDRDSSGDDDNFARIYNF